MKRHLNLVLGIIIAAACADPVQSSNEDAIPDDGKPDGPDHHVGEWCTACHSEHGSGPEFSVAGTVFVAKGSNTPASGAVVHVKDGNGNTHDIPVYDSGNFYRSKEQYDPKYPLSISVTYQGQEQKMESIIGRDGGCGRCHANTSTGNSSHAPRIFATKPAPTTDAGATDAGTDGGS